MNKYNYLKSINAEYIEDLFIQYLNNPDSVDDSWKFFFEGMELNPSKESSPLNGAISANGSALQTQKNVLELVPNKKGVHLSSEAKVADLIHAYRERGHLIANTDPLTPALTSHPLLELSLFELSDKDLDREFTAGKLIGANTTSLKNILSRLKTTYCRTIGVQYTHIQDPDSRQWLQDKMESSLNQEFLSANEKKFILKRLIESETFERFLHTRYVAQKRFSVEGGESLISGLDRIIQVGADLGAEQFVMGMAHRGRLNVLANLFGKKFEQIFAEFQDNYATDTSTSEGDVKYHKGYSADITTESGKSVHLSLTSNPSHLEFVNPVVEGITRGKQRILKDLDRTKVIPILIHGDSAFSGQGVIYETLNLSQLEGYKTGGTIHVVINNQVGFTTSPHDSRSTTYCTDIAKMLEVPIFHINGDDPEAMWLAAKLSMEYRLKFKKDVFIDLICYRKYGHNEGDEPSFTQPLMYKKIKTHLSTREQYSEKLKNAGIVTEAESNSMIENFTKALTESQEIAKAGSAQPHASSYQGQWKHLHRATEAEMFAPVDTAVDEEKLRALSKKLNTIPADFKLHPKLVRFFEARQSAVDKGEGLDWGTAETLAYASLLTEGHPVRLSGQDVGRGTFTHRHAVLHDFEKGHAYVPLNHLDKTQAEMIIFNSNLSETAVLGFDYGWSLADPNALVIWEAQFGDFGNGAQVIIDQFISTSESKWQRASGIVLNLPHGYEGQGPEHSSARLERFLQLCGRFNMIVGNFTTPAQLFHALRRQMKRTFRKPLVLMTPKSLLRHPQAVSSLSELSNGRFNEVIDDVIPNKKSAKRLLLCSGKIYYELLAKREELGRDDIAIIRVEQIYPWPKEQITEVLKSYSEKVPVYWVQEEPQNMGAWSFVFNFWCGGQSKFHEKIHNRPISYIGREIGAAPAVGSPKIHAKEQKEILEKSLNIE